MKKTDSNTVDSNASPAPTAALSGLGEGGTELINTDANDRNLGIPEEFINSELANVISSTLRESKETAYSRYFWFDDNSFPAEIPEISNILINKIADSTSLILNDIRSNSSSTVLLNLSSNIITNSNDSSENPVYSYLYEEWGADSNFNIFVATVGDVATTTIAPRINNNTMRNDDISPVLDNLNSTASIIDNFAAEVTSPSLITNSELIDNSIITETMYEYITNLAYLAPLNWFDSYVFLFNRPLASFCILFSMYQYFDRVCRLRRNAWLNISRFSHRSSAVRFRDRFQPWFIRFFFRVHGFNVPNLDKDFEKLLKIRRFFNKILKKRH